MSPPPQPVGKTNLARLLVTYRDEQRLTLREAALEAGVHYTTLSRLERGQTTCTLDTAVKLANWMRLPLDVINRPAPPPHPKARIPRLPRHTSLAGRSPVPV